jgi:hypothetical protein
MNDLDFDLGLALSIVAPGTKWRLIGNSFDGLEWLDESKRPTEPELRDGLAAYQSVINNRKIWASSATFWGEFTDSEKLAILNSTVAGIILLREELRLWMGEVWSDDAKVQAGLTALVAAGILTNDRKAAILDQ